MSEIVNGTLLTEVFVTLFVIMDPVGCIPIFLGLTSALPNALVKRAAFQAVALAFVVIVAFAIFGQWILTYLGISLAALQCSGGLLLLLVSLELLTGNASEPSATAGANVALVPLGTPLLAGPGAIVATMVFARQVHHFADFSALAIGIVVVHILLWLSMRFSIPLLKLIRDSGVQILTRIAGVLLAAIAVQMVADSVRAFIQA